MPANTIGEILKVTTWGESHGKAIGVVIDGCPAGIPLTEEDIQKELDKRKPGLSSATSQRQEEDKAHIYSGVFENKTTGTPISIVIFNKDSDPSKYEKIKDLYRPGHADYTYDKKYGFRDYRGGGRSSARETATRVAAGAVAKKLLQKQNIKIHAYSKQIGKVQAEKIEVNKVYENHLRTADPQKVEQMQEEIEQAKRDNDSLGGVVEVIIQNCPAGLGEPVFDKLDADISKAIMSLGAVKGIEFGQGFNAANLKASENNDAMGSSGFKTNNAGGILGGISTGQDITLRFAVKPTPSIQKEQQTTTQNNKESTIRIEGRHDPCILPRIVPVAENMLAMVLADKLLLNKLSKVEE